MSANTKMQTTLASMTTEAQRTRIGDALAGLTPQSALRAA